ncbi:hypothetical protein V8C34DRAFT_286937 [Trichoderma compactum]
MRLNPFAPSRRKVFFFTGDLDGVVFRAHSCGNGRFIQGTPGLDLEICFRLHKCKSSLSIFIYQDNLRRWLRAIPSLRDHLGNDLFGPVVSINLLLPRYPEMSAKFDQDRREGRSFDALDLFVHHFLREGSVFAAFGLEHLHKSGLLTDAHLHDILSQSRSMSKDLDLLDEAVDEIDERDIKGPNRSLRFVDDLFQSQLPTAIRQREAQERRNMAHWLLAKVAISCQKLLDASTMQNASAGVMAFANQVGTSASVWKSGTRVIRDVCEGYKPRSLSDIVSALQVANAMEEIISLSGLGYSMVEFIDDIPRWASLLSPDDQHLFFEIASHLWGIPASTVAQVMDSFARPLMSLQGIVEHLVRISGLSDHGSGNSHQLQTLRQQYLFDARPTITCEKGPTLTEWNPLPKPAVQEIPPTNTPRPPDPEDCSPSESSHLTALSPATTILSPLLITATPGSTTMGTSVDETVYCEHCNSTFKLGKNGRRGQASNLQKHVKIHHPETILDYRRVIYNCRYGCGTRDPNKSNIKAHENKHCANRKGKQPRCHGKWRQTIT